MSGVGATQDAHISHSGAQPASQRGNDATGPQGQQRALRYLQDPVSEGARAWVAFGYELALRLAGLVAKVLPDATVAVAERI
jgi:hypothetical protein